MTTKAEASHSQNRLAGVSNSLPCGLHLRPFKYGLLISELVLTQEVCGLITMNVFPIAFMFWQCLALTVAFSFDSCRTHQLDIV